MTTEKIGSEEPEHKAPIEELVDLAQDLAARRGGSRVASVALVSVCEDGCVGTAWFCDKESSMFELVGGVQLLSIRMMLDVEHGGEKGV